ncbi:MAG: bifunctional phosphoribosylaminoimidazolecarboxamide formyltransferase/IMP cyclohydrolase [Bdellovibrionales bacterium]|nr:bifunctional phosphoribosylaminoimidazolecarboxamide formyltransferase/IMP cyclohydrolase [Bdellovibrionales bacterium]
MKYNRALVSVSDKSGLIEFIKPLADEGTSIVSTGGTAKYLRDHGVAVVDVSEVTDFPEVMDGRVKTLHPKVHMGLLARLGHVEDQKTLDQFKVNVFDLVVGNLYPFESAKKENKSESELIEYIDIGGPSFLRAAAKSFERITVICDPNDYEAALKGSDVKMRKCLAAKVFRHTAHYDLVIAGTLDDPLTHSQFSAGGRLVSELRYGENPHQKAYWYSNSLQSHGIHQAQIIQGKQLSYNNLLDLDATISTLQLFSKPSCVAVKHLNPCGVALGEDLTEVVEKALAADPVSVFGGIIAVNGLVDEKIAVLLSKIFLECVVAPDFSQEALEVFSRKQNMRVLKWPGLMKSKDQYQLKSILGGYLVQTADNFDQEMKSDWKIIGLDPDQQMENNINMGLRVCSRLKSNAIAIVGREQTLGLGMGQVNRVDAVEQAVQRWQKFHADQKNVVLVSDAFFPFADSIELCAKAGIQWVVQPGGSVKDDEVIQKARELNINMVLTGKRHFYH